jgi:hypothetical protein
MQLTLQNMRLVGAAKLKLLGTFTAALLVLIAACFEVKIIDFKMY